MRQLSGSDTAMLFVDRPNAPNTIAPLTIYDASSAPGGSVSYEDVLAHVQSRLDVTPSFRERLVRVPFNLDRPFWMRSPDFDLEYHVREIALPRPGTWRQLCTQVARIGARPLDLDRPPWELYLIQGLDAIDGVPKGAFATLLKLHHAAVDGVSGAEILTALHDVEGQPTPAVEPRSWEPERPPGALELLGRAAFHTLTRPASAVGMLRPVTRSLRSRRDSPEGRPGAFLPATRFQGPVSPHRAIGGITVDLADLKSLKRAYPGATVNDVGLTIVGGALKRYLDAKGETPTETLVALMPVSIRPTVTRAPSEVARVEAAAGGNLFAMLPVSLATDVTDPVERLRTIQRATESAKVDAIGARALSEVSELLPGALMASAQRAVMRLVNRSGRTLGVHTTVTNVPGAQVPVYFCGAKALIMAGMMPVVDGQRLLNGIGSYNGSVMFIFTADRAAMPDPELYEDCLRESFAELQSATGLTAGTSTPRRPAAT
jgi:WS/DGAT/MGAT family acyltransferase